MSAFSDFYENKIIDHMLRGQAYTVPTTVYVALFTANTGLEANNPTSEVSASGTAYTRVAVTLSAASGGAIAAEAEGSATATIRKAKADREAAIFRAEGQAKALDIIAESEKNYLNTLSESIGKDEAAKILMAQKVLEGYAVISDKPGDKVFIPNSVKPFLDLGNN